MQLVYWEMLHTGGLSGTSSVANGQLFSKFHTPLKFIIYTLSSFNENNLSNIRVYYDSVYYHWSELISDRNIYMQIYFVKKTILIIYIDFVLKNTNFLKLDCQHIFSMSTHYFTYVNQPNSMYQ